MQNNNKKTIADILDRASSHSLLVGREQELAQLSALHTQESPLVAFLFGIPGIGKTALMNKYLQQAQTDTVVIIHLDANRFEPTPLAFNSEIARQLKVETDTIADTLAEIDRRVVVAIDNYQTMRLLDRWLRDEFLPTMSSNVRLLLAGNCRPGAGWTVRSPWNELTQMIELLPLSPKHSVELLLKRSFSIAQAQYIQSIAKGYPMALSMAVSIMSDSESGNTDESFSSRLMTELATAYLSTIDDEKLVALLKELALFRRITLPLLTALRPEAAADKLYQRLADIEFVKQTSEGLSIHDAVRDVLVVSLNAENPNRVRQAKRQIWSLLAAELKEAHELNLWRFTADTIFLLSDPVIREAFFPKEVPFLDVLPASRLPAGPNISSALAEGATSAERAIFDICLRHESEPAGEIIRAWWQHAPESFKVIHNSQGEVSGFFIAMEANQIPKVLQQQDPLLQLWLKHKKNARLPAGQKALFIRRWLSVDSADRPSAEQAAAWLDLKRTYLEMWPDLRLVYLTVKELTPYSEVATRLGFQALQELSAELGGETFHGAVLDMGPASVNGWLHRLLAKELGISQLDFLDPEAQAVIVNGMRIKLTPLEFKLAAYLYAYMGTAISRERLLDNVWGYSYTGGSNVVDAVVKTLRRKLGNDAGQIKTVRGHGYALELGLFQTDR